MSAWGGRAPAGAAHLVEAVDLTVEYRARGRAGLVRRRRVRAVDRVSIAIGRGRVLGLIGESGSGKTTVGRALLGLTVPTGGRISFDGADVSRRSRATMRRLSTRVQAIFQDTSSTLDPRMTVRHSLYEALRRRPDRPGTLADRAAAALSSVGLGAELLDRLPHQLSGGQRQRVGIARALAVEPEFVVCDEPTASLDVSVQAQVLNLLAGLRDRLGLTYLFIGHNIAVVRYLSDEVAVMFAGRIVEHGPADQVCRRPYHPYTRALVAAVSGRGPTERAGTDGPAGAAAGRGGTEELAGAAAGGGGMEELAGAAAGGCPVRHRCPLTAALGHPARCAEAVPELCEIEPGHRVACHFAEAEGVRQEVD
jgi:ABC-type glutathione transport system ATPase component